ncbi:MAG: hypothetical protein WCC92_03025 [Candidatus Korobacteraceae bacterium]
MLSEVTQHVTGERCRTALEFDALPFGRGDVTAGSEDELQAVVLGKSDRCDLPISIRESRFFRNISKRISSGEAPRQAYLDLQEFLSESQDVWENSWVRFPERKLSRNALDMFRDDLGLDDQGAAKPKRSDWTRYCFEQSGERWLRVPISYILKLALADVVGTQPHMPERLRMEASRLMQHFSNDNTSPETTSFHVVVPREGHTTGEELARESARRFLLTSLLMSWANHCFGLLEHGQRAIIYHAPHPPVRQTALSSRISDAFYRELFMSPCLSGWEDGEAKSQYMHLCHQVLSRSQLNSVAKLREAGIIANNLIVLPSLSNVSLANNGIHISLGSKALARAMQELPTDLAGREEKRLGDLAIKIFEHFLPLFVGTYSAAPYRIDFSQFHAEQLLAFLPHELDFTHLRLMWREWKEKAKLRVLGSPVTPYGPEWVDGLVSRVFRLRGDLVPDYRLINYPVAWLSTEHASALDGIPGNTDRLASELEQQGIVDSRLSFYMPMRLRQFGAMGFSGFEARYYSLFPSYDRDMVPATDLQQLLLVVAYQCALSEAIVPEEIPDDPTSESERRQPFFFAAAGLPAFYVRKNSRNQLLRRILSYSKHTRSSWRHPDYLRVSLRDYRHALVDFLEDSVPEAIDALEAHYLLGELRIRLADQSLQAGARLTQGTLSEAGSKNPMHLRAAEFNQAAEEYYREGLRTAQLAEAFQHLREDLVLRHNEGDSVALNVTRCEMRVQDPLRFLDSIRERLLRDELSTHELTLLLNLLLIFTADAQPCEAGNLPKANDARILS